MQVGNILLSLAGDSGNTVAKYEVTPSEVAVLQHIHGDDAVNDIEPVGEVERSHREERQRLIEIYGRNQDGRFVCPSVEALFPGAASRLFDRFDELPLADDQYKPETRVKSTPAATIAKPVVEPDDKPVKGKKGRGKKAAEPAPEPEQADDDEKDGIEEMPDSNLFK